MKKIYTILFFIIGMYSIAGATEYTTTLEWLNYSGSNVLCDGDSMELKASVQSDDGSPLLINYFTWEIRYLNIDGTPISIWNNLNGGPIQDDSLMVYYPNINIPYSFQFRVLSFVFNGIGFNRDTIYLSPSSISLQRKINVINSFPLSPSCREINIGVCALIMDYPLLFNSTFSISIYDSLDVLLSQRTIDTLFRDGNTYYTYLDTLPAGKLKINMQLLQNGINYCNYDTTFNITISEYPPILFSSKRYGCPINNELDTPLILITLDTNLLNIYNTNSVEFSINGGQTWENNPQNSAEGLWYLYPYNPNDTAFVKVRTIYGCESEQIDTILPFIGIPPKIVWDSVVYPLPDSSRLGKISFHIEEGIAPYYISWSTNSTGANIIDTIYNSNIVTITDIFPNTYYLTVYDSSLCRDIMRFDLRFPDIVMSHSELLDYLPGNINENTPFYVSSTSIDSCNGSFQFYIRGGEPPYEIILQRFIQEPFPPYNFYRSDTVLYSTVPKTFIFNNICNQYYVLDYTDQSNCFYNYPLFWQKYPNNDTAYFTEFGQVNTPQVITFDNYYHSTCGGENSINLSNYIDSNMYDINDYNFIWLNIEAIKDTQYCNTNLKKLDFILDAQIDSILEITNSNNGQIYWVVAVNKYTQEYSIANIPIIVEYIPEAAGLPEGNYLIPSQVYVGDTVVIVDVSYETDSITIRDAFGTTEPILINQTDNYFFVRFDSVGEFNLEMEAYNFYGQDTLIGDFGFASNDTFIYDRYCKAEFSRTITVLPKIDTTEIIYYPNIIKKAILYPNPNNGQFTVDIELSEIADVRSTLIHFDTRNILEVQEGSNQQKYLLQFNVNNFVAGTYMVTVETAKGAITLKVILN